MVPSFHKAGGQYVFLALGWFPVLIGAIIVASAVSSHLAQTTSPCYTSIIPKKATSSIPASTAFCATHLCGGSALFIGLALLNGNANAIAFAILVPLGFIGWTRLVEEKELIERFGATILITASTSPHFFRSCATLVTSSSFCSQENNR